MELRRVIVAVSRHTTGSARVKKPVDQSKQVMVLTDAVHTMPWSMVTIHIAAARRHQTLSPQSTVESAAVAFTMEPQESVVVSRQASLSPAL